MLDDDDNDADDGSDLLPEVRVNNLVCTWYIGKSNLDLDAMSRRAPFLTYDPQRFAAAICHMQAPKATCLLFNTGRGVCAGTKSKEMAFLAVTHLVSLIQRAGFFFGSVQEFNVRNLVASARCPFTIDLQRMAEAISSHCTYHAGLFPGLRFKPGVDGNTQQALLLYRNGGTVITGNSSVEECMKLWKRVYPIVVRYATDMPVGEENSAEYRVRMKLNENVNKNKNNTNTNNATLATEDDDEDDDDDERGEESRRRRRRRRKSRECANVQREAVVHLSGTCRMTSRELIRHDNDDDDDDNDEGRGRGSSREGEEKPFLSFFSRAALHRRHIKRMRVSAAANPALAEERGQEVVLPSLAAGGGQQQKQQSPVNAGRAFYHPSA